MSESWALLVGLRRGDSVPSELYVLDYRDGSRPDWVVSEAEELATGGRRLTVVDETNTDKGDFFGGSDRIALTVLTWPTKTLRTQPYLLGSTARPMLCDMDQQARRVGNLHQGAPC